MSRLPEGEPPRSADFSEMAQDQDYLREVDLIRKDFATADAEVELFRQRGEKFGENCAKTVKGFEAFCARNNLTVLDPRDQYNMLVRLADLGGNIHPTIRLVVTPDMDEKGSFLSDGVNVEIDVGADTYKEKFMQPKIISQFQVDEGSLNNLKRKTVPRLRKALRIARSITEADLTDSRPLRPATL